MTETRTARMGIHAHHAQALDRALTVPDGCLRAADRSAALARCASAGRLVARALAKQGLAHALVAPFRGRPRAPPHRASAMTGMVTSRGWIAASRAAAGPARTPRPPAPRGDAPKQGRAAREFERASIPRAIDPKETAAHDGAKTPDAAEPGDAGAAQKGALEAARPADLQPRTGLMRWS